MKTHQELIPDNIKSELEEILKPINPELYDTAVKFLVSELKAMFRELSEHRSSTEANAREVLARRQERVLVKLQELFDGYQVQIEEAFRLMSELMQEQFNKQKGKKYL
jgi:hypothetical protein